MNNTALPRLVSDELLERLDAMPALVLTGARQTGKSTLVRSLLPETRRYQSLDDLSVIASTQQQIQRPNRLMYLRNARQ